MALHMNVYRTLTDKVIFRLRNSASSLYRYHLSVVVVAVICNLVLKQLFE
jgi:hypothetical protein